METWHNTTVLVNVPIQLPEGTSTAHNGASTSFNVLMTVLNGSRILPLKLNPKIASTMKLYFPLISGADGRSVINGMSISVH